ncbi:GntR family transcriptional regulator [Nocardioides astragali]|uniref:GntR family transcriptional regulator n=1 Tax=Nocardioides astragali TaxID=1776736 RepID=A0ABW2N579_9ACTN|nr:GntR family transcriptional regulator [Nocardioides astragali]
MAEHLRLTVDRRSPVPLYYQVAKQLEEAIASGEVSPGFKLDNEISLADQLGLSRPTMRRAIQELVDKGLLVRKRGVGTQVVHGRVHRELELTSLYDDLRTSGQQPATKVLLNVLEPAAAEVADELGIAEGDEVLHLERLRLADDEPLAVLRNWLPANVVSPTDEELEGGGLYQLIRDAGTHVQIARQRIGARGATTHEARLLGRRKNDAVLTMQRTAYADSGLAIEYGDHCYRPESYSFEVTLVER